MEETLKPKFRYKASGQIYEPEDFQLRIKSVNRWNVTLISQSAILFTHQETIPARNAIDVSVKEVMGNDELLLSILGTFAQCTRSLHAPGGV